MQKLFGSKKEAPPPAVKTLNEMSKDELRDKQRSMQRELQKEMREMDRQNMQIEMARKKSESELQKELKKKDKGDKFIKQTYARQMIVCQQNKERNLVNKGKVQNLSYSIDNMFANIKMAQAMGMASNIMKDINKCMNINALNGTMQELSKEMMKMGIVQEQIDDAMDNMNDNVDLGDMEQQVSYFYDDYSINQADDLIMQMEKGQAGSDKHLPQQQQHLQEQQQQFNQGDEMDEMEKKLQQL